MREDQGDAIPLQYLPVPDDLFSPLDDEWEDEDEEEEEPMENEGILHETEPEVSMDVDATIDPPPLERVNAEVRTPSRQASPPLPLSPISNPSTPPRKRPRTSRNWSPPPHIPSFLPPFPSEKASATRTPSPPPLRDDSPAIPHPNPVKMEQRASPVPELASSMTNAADYLTPLPFSVSSLAASSSPWHLPSRPPKSPPPSTFGSSSTPPNLPQTQQALFGAYHYILTNPVPAETTPAHPGRYKVALSLVHQAEAHPRWEPPPTLYASPEPNMPRIATVGPTYPVPVSMSEKEKENGSGEPETRLPPAPPMPAATSDRIAPSIAQQGSRFSAVAKELLPVRPILLSYRMYSYTFLAISDKSIRVRLDSRTLPCSSATRARRRRKSDSYTDQGSTRPGTLALRPPPLLVSLPAPQNRQERRARMVKTRAVGLQQGRCFQTQRCSRLGIGSRKILGRRCHTRVGRGWEV